MRHSPRKPASDRLTAVTTRRVCRCGNSEESGARFCSSCGVSIDDDTRLLESSAEMTVVDQARSSGIDRRWLGVAVALIVAFVGWSAWSGSSPGNAPEGADAPQAHARTTGLPTTVVPMTTAAPVTTAPAAATQTTRAVTATKNEAVVSQVGSGEPLLGEITGLRAIFVQRPDQLSVLDLDTGALAAVPSSFGWVEPFVVSGDWLVARTDDSLSALPLDDLGDVPVRLLPDRNPTFGVGLAFAEPRPDGRIWLVVYADPSPEFVQVDLATGAVIEEFTPPQGALAHAWIRQDAEGDRVVLSSTDGGVYESDGDGYRRVAEGRLIISDDDRALVETCDERLTCERRWLDRATWQRVDFVLPPGPFREATFLGGTDWLLLAAWENDIEEQTLFNVVTGQLRSLDGADHLGFEQQAPPISPDGRWMALHDDARLVILDLVTDERHVIDDVGPLAGGVVLTDAPVSIS